MTTMGKKRKSTKTPAKRCEALNSLIVRSRGYCEGGWTKTCPSGVLQCAHLWSARYAATRFDERNCLCLCQGCHMWLDSHEIEKDEIRKNHFGDDYDDYRALAQSFMQRRAPDWRELEARLKARADELGIAA